MSSCALVSIFLLHYAMKFLGNGLVVVVAMKFLRMCGVWPFVVQFVEKALKINQVDPSTIKSTSENSIDMVLSWICLRQKSNAISNQQFHETSYCAF